MIANDLSKRLTRWRSRSPSALTRPTLCLPGSCKSRSTSRALSHHATSSAASLLAHQGSTKSSSFWPCSTSPEEMPSWCLRPSQPYFMQRSKQDTPHTGQRHSVWPQSQGVKQSEKRLKTMITPLDLSPVLKEVLHGAVVFNLPPYRRQETHILTPARRLT